MVLHLNKIENEDRRCLMVERLLKDPQYGLHFDDKTLNISNYRLPRNMLFGTGIATSITETNKSIT